MEIFCSQYITHFNNISLFRILHNMRVWSWFRLIVISYIMFVVRCYWCALRVGVKYSGMVVLLDLLLGLSIFVFCFLFRCCYLIVMGGGSACFGYCAFGCLELLFYFVFFCFVILYNFGSSCTSRASFS
jgi:hypothetical protein